MFRRLHKWSFIAVILAVWGVLLSQSCDRGGGEDEDDQASAEAVESDEENAQDQQNGEANGPGAMALPGEAEPGSMQPEDVGPEAPAVFFLSGLKGYLEPCGCDADVLLGGIDRIAGYIDAASEHHPDTAMLDAGDMLFEFDEISEHDEPQERARVEVVVAAQKKLGTEVTVPGENDFALGTDYYREKIGEAGVEPIAANLTIGGEELAASRVVELDDVKLGVVGAVEPALYEGIEGVETSEAIPAIEEAVAQLRGDGVESILLLMHGTLGTTQEAIREVDGIDFGVVGHGPRETDQVYEVDGGYTLEAYDQGRYLGVLKLYERDPSAAYANAGAGSQTELEKVEGLIEHKENQIEQFPPSKRRENPPVLERIREQIEELEAQREELRKGEVDVPDEGNAFIYRPVAMEPGYPIDEELRDRRAQYNKQLAEIQAQVDREVPPVEEGEPFFIGNAECATCHASEQEFWEHTKHADAVETLEQRDKQFDQDCIGCHVVGYEKPGGSVLGKMQYEATLGDKTFEKDLEDVGCETCHGPGSNHALEPVGSDGNPQHIDPTPDENACMQCHVPEHSPNFNFDAYVEDITGEGHEMKSQ